MAGSEDDHPTPPSDDSGLWNVNHMRGLVSGFLDVLASHVERTKASGSPEASAEETEANRRAEERHA